MLQQKRSLVSMTIALVIIMVGLLLVCAQQRSNVAPGEDLSMDDEQFRQELLDMLDLVDEPQDTTSFDELGLTDDNQSDEVLSLLVPDREETPEVIDTTPRASASTMGLSEEMFVNVQNDISRLENLLEERSASVDSLKRIIENRNVRLQKIENQVTQNREHHIGMPSKTTVSQRPKTTITQKSTTNSSSSPFMAEYKSARSYFERFEYQNAIQEFKDLLSRYPNHKMADNCQYWIGECYYGMKDYNTAVIELQKVFAYSETDKHDDAQLMIALSYVKSGQKDRAQVEFENFLNNYSGSEYTAIAQKYHKNI